MSKFTEAQREIIKKQIWDLEKAGYGTTQILQKLEDAGFSMTYRSLENYKIGIAKIMADTNKKAILFDRLQLENDIKEAIKNAQVAQTQASTPVEKNEWYETLINLRSRLVLTKQGVIDGFDIINGLQPKTGGDRREEKTATKEFRAFIANTMG